MSSILEEIETQIAGLKTTTSKSNVGVVRETGDGVARIEGLSDVMLNEMIEFSSGVFGLALNLEETEVGAILLGDSTQVMEGDEAKTTGKLLQVPVGQGLPAQGSSPALLYLRRDRPEKFERRPCAGHSGKGRCDALHDDYFRAGLRHGDEPISGAICRRRDGRVVHG